MPAQRGRQVVLLAEEVDRCRLAVVRGDDRGSAALLRRQRRDDARDRGGELWPAVHVGPVLRKRRRPRVLGARRLEVQPGRDESVVAQESRDRQDRQDVRNRRQARRDRDAGDHGSQPGSRVRRALDRDGAGGEQHRVDVGGIVVLRVRRDHRGEQEDEAESDETRLRVREQPHQARDPGERQHGIRDEQLGQQVPAWREDHVLALLPVAKHLEDREAVRCLPRDVREHQRSREGHAADEPARPQDFALRRAGDRRCEGRDEIGDAVLRQGADADGGADGQP